MHKKISALLCLSVLVGCGSPGQSSLGTASTSSQTDTIAISGQTTPSVAPEGPAPFEARSYDGQNNNLSQPSWGSANTPFVEDVVRAYADGQSQPSGSDRPGPRQISNAVVAQSSVLDDPAGRSAFLWVWGQFLDHDLDLTFSNGLNDFPIPIPTGDIYFDPSGSGTQTLPFSRSLALEGSNPRQQVNSITAFIDASQVYGSDEATALSLRTLSDGLMSTSAGDLPPLDARGSFVCGDIRANENLALTSLQTIFLREHNRRARQLKATDPSLDDEAIYQRARKSVGALIQVITYREYLPILLGRDTLPRYAGYRSDTDPGVGILFATAAYRLGHSQVGSNLPRLDEAGQEIPEGNLNVADAFFNPSLIVNEGGIEPLVRGLAVTAAQATDPQVIDDLRNFLFGAPGAGGLDLPSLNIQRGRDHGLPDYNTIRVAAGRSTANAFSDITQNGARQLALASVYATPDQIDPWVGLLSEDPAPGAVVGPTLQRILRAQFLRTRDGDRFFYLNDPALQAERAELESTTLAQVVARNTGISSLQTNLFLLPNAVPGPSPTGRPRRAPRPIPPPQL